MEDPVVLAQTGQTFDKVSIETWFARENSSRCPLTGEALSTTQTVPNYALRSLIQTWAQEHGAEDVSEYNTRFGKVRRLSSRLGSLSLRGSADVESASSSGRDNSDDDGGTANAPTEADNEQEGTGQEETEASRFYPALLPAAEPQERPVSTAGDHGPHTLSAANLEPHVARELTHSDTTIARRGSVEPEDLTWHDTAAGEQPGAYPSVRHTPVTPANRIQAMQVRGK